ncbi:hypothetical protein OAB57_00290 [Bacteriovoracaceae bacterium]|nr:hypothetical protein [Bacteriovoracaceae bacterium]
MSFIYIIFISTAFAQDIASVIYYPSQRNKGSTHMELRIGDLIYSLGKGFNNRRHYVDAVDRSINGQFGFLEFELDINETEKEKIVQMISRNQVDCSNTCVNGVCDAIEKGTTLRFGSLTREIPTAMALNLSMKRILPWTSVSGIKSVGIKGVGDFIISAALIEFLLSIPLTIPSVCYDLIQSSCYK